MEGTTQGYWTGWFTWHGGQYVKAHSCRVQPIEEYTSVSSRKEKNMETNEETKKN